VHTRSRTCAGELDDERIAADLRANERESTHELSVPPRTTSVSVTLRGKVKSLSTSEEIELTAGTSVFRINGIDATDEVTSALLSRTSSGYIVEVRGKNGEPAAGHPVSLELKHEDLRRTRSIALQTDAAGRIELGELAGIERAQLTGVGAESVTWHLAAPVRSGAPSDVHALVGEVVRVP
jgi:hypothetical protein